MYGNTTSDAVSFEWVSEWMYHAVSHEINNIFWKIHAFNPFHAIDIFWYPLKTFQGVSKEISGMKWVNDKWK